MTEIEIALTDAESALRRLRKALGGAHVAVSLSEPWDPDGDDSLALEVAHIASRTPRYDGSGDAMRTLDRHRWKGKDAAETSARAVADGPCGCETCASKAHRLAHRMAKEANR